MNTEDLTRTFPFTVRPGHRETLDSYTRRILALNGEPDTLPGELLAFAKNTDPDATWQSILETKTGRTLSRLATPVTDTHDESAGCRACAALLTDRFGCVQCHHGAHVQQHPHLDDFICERHRRWIGPGTTPTTQRTVTARQVAAHRQLRALRRDGRADMELLLDLLAALTTDLGTGDHDVFHHAVAILRWLTRRDTLHRLFDPAIAYATTFAWLAEAIDNLVARATPATARAVWLHLWPAHLALQTAYRGYTGYHAGHPHEFALPADIADWYPRPATFQSHNDYLACTGDTNLSALAQRAREENSDTPSVTAPRLRQVRCPRGHSYTDVVTGPEDTSPRTPCPGCTGFHVRRGVNDLATVAPHLAAQLHPTLNGDLTAEGITARSSKSVWWQCEKGHPYPAAPFNRTLNDAGCSVCLNRIVLKGVNDFATTHPRLARELHPRSARHQSATAFNAADTKKRLWLCAAGHDFKASARERANGTHTCKECKKRRTRSSGRSLADTHPDLASTWRPELNEGREPCDYTKGARLDVVWWCEEGGHTFSMRIEARTRGCGCPYCAGRLLLTGFNDFATTHPELAGDWHPYKNRKYASEVMAGSAIKHYWRCKDGHETEQSIARRIASKGCTRCPAYERAGRPVPSESAVRPDTHYGARRQATQKRTTRQENEEVRHAAAA